ncbi:MAG: 3'-5' exonuclease [Verrucomicrobiales bacterium]|nr:3'-5' exonuclease [Verrucomicrobiales bacterium]
MELRIADTFQDSLLQLSDNEQKAIRNTVYDLQGDKSLPSVKFHRIARSKDKNFRSVNVDRNLHAVVHKTKKNVLLCFVGKQDQVRKWAEVRKIEKHPRTGAAQIVELRDKVINFPTPEELPASPGKKYLFAKLTDDDLLGYGVPEEWINDVRSVTEDSLLELADHLPQEAAEALLEIATGGKPTVASNGNQPECDEGFSHPDAQRRFRLVSDEKELALALDYPWEKWTVFLHPSQRRIVERDYKGPARISGSAGTGKTVVGLHRALHLGRNNPAANILVTTISDALAHLIKIKLDRLVSPDSDLGMRITVKSIKEVARELWAPLHPDCKIAEGDEVDAALMEATYRLDESGFTKAFIHDEWDEVIDARQVSTWEEYKNAPRAGRKKRLSELQRDRLWKIFEETKSILNGAGLRTWSNVFYTLAEQLKTGECSNPFDFVVVDEAQDIGIPDLRFLGVVGGNRPDGLFFTGDLGQRIFQAPFSWSKEGVNIVGRTYTLKVNYRTSHQIRQRADMLLPDHVSDLDGNVEDRKGTISVFNGPPPSVRLFRNANEEIKAVADQIKKLQKQGLINEEIGIFVRSPSLMSRARAAVNAADADWRELGDTDEFTAGQISISTMHLAKGFEYRAVIVMACDRDAIPLQERVEEMSVSEEVDMEEVLASERQLLYVAATRARDQLFFTGTQPGSEFLKPMELTE